MVYLILMLVVIVIGIMIVTKGQFLVLFKQRELSALFEPGKFSVKDAMFDAKCELRNGNYEYRNLVLTISGFRFLDPGDEEENEVRVVLALNLGDRLITHEPINEKLIVCRKEPGEQELRCPSPSEPVALTFSRFPTTFSPSENDLIHVTAWRYSAGVENLLGSGATLSDMIEAEFQSYMGSIDAKGKIEDFQTVCAASICLSCGAFCTQSQCEQNSFCWFQPHVASFLPGGNCIACSEARSCGEYSKETCQRCGSISNCVWEDGQNKCLGTSA